MGKVLTNYECEGQFSIFDLFAVPKAEKELFPGFKLLCCDVIRGSGFVGGKERILKFFRENDSPAHRAVMLKDEYGWGGAYPAFTFDGKRYGDMSDSKGIVLEPMDGGKDIRFTWAQVERAIDYKIKTGEY